jgi:hypothetical protein
MLIQGKMFKVLRWRNEAMPSARDLAIADHIKALEKALEGSSWESVKLRIADVVLDLAVVAWHNHTTIEECLDLKIQLEKNRNEESKKKAD